MLGHEEVIDLTNDEEQTERDDEQTGRTEPKSPPRFQTRKRRNTKQSTSCDNRRNKRKRLKSEITKSTSKIKADTSAAKTKRKRSSCNSEGKNRESGSEKYKKALINFWEQNGVESNVKALRNGVKRKFFGPIDFLFLKIAVKAFGEEKLNHKDRKYGTWNSAADYYADLKGIKPPTDVRNRGWRLKGLWTKFVKDYDDYNPDDIDEEMEIEEDFIFPESLTFNEEVLPEENVIGSMIQYFKDTVSEIKVASQKRVKQSRQSKHLIEILGDISKNLTVHGDSGKEERTTVLLAQSGMGKSATVNEAARQTEITNDLYQLLKAEQGGKVDGSYDHFQIPRDYFEEAKMKEKLEAEQKLEDMYMSICKRNDEILPDFILPQAKAFDTEACTPIIMEITYGAYALKLDNYEEEELKTMLSDVDWKGYEDDMKENEASAIHRERMQNLLRTLQQQTTEEDFEEDYSFEDSESGSDDFEMGDEKTRQQPESIEFPTYKDKNSVKINPSMMQHVGKKIFCTGNENTSILQDRVFIREKILEIIRSKYCGLIKRLVISIPCLVAKNNRILEVPGTDDKDPLHRSQLIKALNLANNVIVLSSEKSLNVVSDRVKDLLDEHVLDRWVSSSLRLSILSCPKSSKQRLSCQDLVKDVNESVKSKWKSFCKDFLNGAYSYLARKLKEKDAGRFCSKQAITKFFKKNLRVACCQLMLGSALQRTSKYIYIRNNGEIYNDSRKYAQSTRMLSMLWGRMGGEEPHPLWNLENELLGTAYVKKQGGSSFRMSDEWMDRPQDGPQVDKGKIPREVATKYLNGKQSTFKNIAREFNHDNRVKEKLQEIKKMFDLNGKVCEKVRSELEREDHQNTLRECIRQITSYVNKLRPSELRILLDPNTEGSQGVFSMGKKLRPYIDKALQGKLKEILSEQFKEIKRDFSKQLRNVFSERAKSFFVGDKDCSEKEKLAFEEWIRKKFLKREAIQKMLEYRFGDMKKLLDRCETERWVVETISNTIRAWCRKCLSNVSPNSSQAKKKIKEIIRASFASLRGEEEGDSDYHYAFEFEEEVAEQFMKTLKKKKWNTRYTKLQNRIFTKNGVVYQWFLGLCKMLADHRPSSDTIGKQIEKFLIGFLRKLVALEKRYDNPAAQQSHRDHKEIERQIDALRYKSIECNGDDGPTRSQLNLDKYPSVKANIRRWTPVERGGNNGQREAAEVDSDGKRLSPKCRFLEEESKRGDYDAAMNTSMQDALKNLQEKRPPRDLGSDRSLLWSLLACRGAKFTQKNKSDQRVDIQGLAEKIGLRILTKMHDGLWHFWIDLAGKGRRRESFGRKQQPPPHFSESSDELLHPGQKDKREKYAGESRKKWLQFVQTFCDHYDCNVCIIAPSLGQVDMITNNSPLNKYPLNKYSKAYFVVWDHSNQSFHAAIPPPIKAIPPVKKPSNPRIERLDNYLNEGFQGKLWEGFNPKIRDREDYKLFLSSWIAPRIQRNSAPCTDVPEEFRGLKVLNQDGDAATAMVVALKRADNETYKRYFGSAGRSRDAAKLLREAIVKELQKLNRTNVYHESKSSQKDWKIHMENLKKGDSFNFLDIKAAADYLKVKISVVDSNEGAFSYTPPPTQQSIKDEYPVVICLWKRRNKSDTLWYALEIEKQGFRRSRETARRKGRRCRKTVRRGKKKEGSRCTRLHGHMGCCR
eukprot:jgi/Bigna1/86186/estExt_fgenesh1_pg.C_80277